MDSDKISSKSDQQDENSTIPDIQINPLTIMTSVPPFKPVDENETNPLENVTISKSTVETDVSVLLDSDLSASNTNADNRSIAAWVEATTTEVQNATMERSPSLPSTLIEATVTRSRGNSTVSTIIDPQQSIASDTLTSQQASYTMDIQRSLSVPLSDPFYLENTNMTLPLENNEENDDNDDSTPTFLPVPESEESEAEKTTKQSPKERAEQILFPSRSPTTTRKISSKQSLNVSFNTSVSFETLHKPPPISRQRRNSLTNDKPRVSIYHRSQSYMTNPRPSLHSLILRKQFCTALSMPNGAFDFKQPPFEQFESITLSTPNTSSSRGSHFRGITSNSSVFSSGRNTSIISDASGRSGIESTNLETSTSEKDRVFSINEEQEELLLRRGTIDTSYTSLTTSNTPSTQSLTSSSDEDFDHLTGRVGQLKLGKTRKKPVDLKRDVLKQLMWLLEKKTTIYAKSNLKYQKPSTPPTKSSTLQQQQQQPNTSNQFLEFCSTFRCNQEADHASKMTTHSLTNSQEHCDELNSLPPLFSQQSYVDPMSLSFTSIRTTHSDSSATTSLINSKPTGRHSFHSGSTNTSLTRKRNYHRRNFASMSMSARERRHSWSKSDQQITSKEQDDKVPLNRSIQAILNEHLIMINQLFAQYLPTNPPYSFQTHTFRDYLYTQLYSLSRQNPMKQRCSRIETKAFIDLITNFHMHRAHHYSFLTDSVKELVRINNDALHHSRPYNETDGDGHVASNESSNTSSPCLTRYASTESKLEINDDGINFDENPLRFFRRLSDEYLFDCEQTESELKKLFDLADQQHILYCLQHVDSGHGNEILSHFHRRLEALFVWFNLYYELTISVKKLSGLLRCNECDDWPKLRFRSIATHRERKAKRAEEDEIYYESTDEEFQDEDINTLDDMNEENEDDSDILPTSRWPDEPMDQFSRLELSENSISNETDCRSKTLNRIDCYRNFVYYMDKRSYQVKYDGLARTLIERVAPVLVKTRLAFLQTNDRRKIEIEQVLAGLTFSDFSSSISNKIDSINNPNADESDDKLIDTDNPVDGDSTRNFNLRELTIEKWLHHVLKSCSTFKTICSSTEDILKNNWLQLHEQLGLPSLLPFYFFIINILLDVMNECLILYHKPYIDNESIEIDSLCRQQLVREAKLVLRDALATRLYSVRMMEQFISNRKISSELTEFDENTVKLYTHYKQYLSTVCINRNFVPNDSESSILTNETDTNLYYYVDEETSELIKEYYFARDLTVTLGNRTEIRDLCIHFSTLTQRILAQLKEELNDKTEKYYQIFAIDLTNQLNLTDGSYSADVISDSTRLSLYFHSSQSIPADIFHNDITINETTASFSEQKKNDIISSTREFRREFDIVKQRATRVCNLIKTLMDDFSIAAEFKCASYHDIWQQLRQNSYIRVKILVNKNDTDDFDDFYVFVPPWLSKDNDKVEKLLSIICSQSIPSDDSTKSINNPHPLYMIFLPKKVSSRHRYQWTGEVLLIQPSESTKLAVNSTEISCLHLNVQRSDQWQQAVNLFCSHMGIENVQLVKKLPRDEDIRLTFEQIPEHVEKLSIKLTDLVRTLNKIWDQDSTKLYLTEIVKFDEFTIESKLVDLVLYIYNSGFDLFRLSYDLIPKIFVINEEIFQRFISLMNEFFCEWCKCVTKKFKYTSIHQKKTAKYKVLRPKWLSPGMVFLSFLAKSSHLQLLSDDDYKKLIKEMPAALDVLYGNSKDLSSIHERIQENLDLVRSSSLSSTHLNRPRGHHRVGSGSRFSDSISSLSQTPRERIAQKIENLENDLESKSRERKQIGKIFTNTTSSTIPDPVISLKMRNIDFPWRRGTRIGQGGAGVAFRAINCSNGSIVCMKEIQLTSIASRSLPSTVPEKLRLIAEEIDMIMSINHPNIVRYFGIERYKRTIYICMEYCLSTVNEFLNDIRSFQNRARTKRTSSFGHSDSSEYDEEIHNEHLRTTSSLDVNENVRGFVWQLLQALMALHEKNIVHCDVKGDNIFIANDKGRYIVKLGDFNLSHRLELESISSDTNGSRSTEKKGTIYFKPPEPEYVYKSDIWALGCTIIEMLTGKLPWTNVTRPPEDQFYIQNQLLAKKGPPIPEELKCQKEACEFIGLCLQPDFQARPSAKELLNHPYPRVRTD